MTMSKVLPFLLAAGLAVAATRSYTVSIIQTGMLGTTELKPGDYKIEVSDQKAVIHSGKTHAESPVKVEEGDARFPATVVRYSNAPDGKVRIQEIHLGGTRTKLVFNM